MSKKNYKLGLRINSYECILDSIDYIESSVKDNKDVIDQLKHIQSWIQEMKQYDKEYQEWLKLDMNLESTWEILYYNEKDLED